MNLLSFFKRPMAALFVSVLLFSACKKDDSNDVRIPVAGLMAFNLSPDQAPVGFTLSGNNLGNGPLNYTSYTGAYLPVYTGTREVRSYNLNTGSTIAIASGNFADSMYYSAFLLGANGSYRNLVVKDELDSLPAVSGKAWVRYINAIADSTVSPVVKIGSGGEDDGLDESAAYAHVSPFAQINAGSVNTSVNGGSITASRTITLEQNKIYTVLLLGLPNQTDTAKAVQIRFIQNGTIEP